MTKPLLLSLATATILVSNLSAESMYERIQAMELQMKQMQTELSALKAEKSSVVSEDEEANDEENKISTDEDIDADEESEEDEDEEEPVQDQLDEIQESITDLTKATNGNHLKFGVDYRFALDNLQYKMADGSTQKNNAFMTNRLWVNMDWKATDTLSFTGQLAYNKAFGARSGWQSNMASMDTFDWISNENAYDDVVRVRTAYFLYRNDTFLGTDIPWTFSVGRRPSTNGHLINLRDDDGASSPMGHAINVEFDGLSAKFGFENLTGVDGMYAKLCAGRGGTNANAKFFSVDQTGAVSNSGAPYSTNGDDIPNIDLVGLIFIPWNNGHYGIATQYYYADNLIDAKFNPTTGQLLGMESVGGMHSLTANFTVNGIGDEINDYLDDTFFFLSGAASITNPDSTKGMLGSADGESKTGYSIWTGLQMPSLMSDDGRWGLEYNHGSQYWRSVTYSEDTNIGSKVAARGDAYEIYFTEPLVEDILTLQLRYTYIDYNYAGSNGFFGNATGSATKISDTMARSSYTVDKAQDIRFYLRYRY